MPARFDANYAGIGQMLRADWMRAEMVRRAEKVKVAAQAAAPVGDARDPHRGRYKTSFRVTSTRKGGSRGNRAEARVVNDAPEAFYVEYGTSKQAGRRVLGQALAAARD